MSKRQFAHAEVFSQYKYIYIYIVIDITLTRQVAKKLNFSIDKPVAYFKKLQPAKKKRKKRVRIYSSVRNLQVNSRRKRERVAFFFNFVRKKNLASEVFTKTANFFSRRRRRHRNKSSRCTFSFGEKLLIAPS